jgi:hypothetical protein
VGLAGTDAHSRSRKGTKCAFGRAERWGHWPEAGSLAPSMANVTGRQEMALLQIGRLRGIT